MSTSTTPVTRSKVHDLARDIRRSAKEIDQTVEAMYFVGVKRMGLPSLQAFVDSEEAAYSQGRLHDLLGEIEGSAALLRELLEVED